MKLHPFSFPIAGFLIGVAVHSLFFEISIIFQVYICFGIATFFLSLFWGMKKLFLYLLLFLLAYLGGLELFSQVLSTAQKQKEMVGEIVQKDSMISVRALVVSEPLERAKTKQFIIEVYSIDSIEVDSFKILVYVDPYQQVGYGDTVVMRGLPEPPENFVTESGRIFDYIHYLSKESVHYIFLFPSVVSISNEIPLTFFQKVTHTLYSIKNELVDTMSERFPQPESGLLAGILFGKKDALDDVTNEQFRKVGLMHIVVLSGYNVSLVIALIMKLLYFLPLRIRSLLAIVGIIGFALLVGAGPTVVRASIMALFIVLSENVGRRYGVQRGLLAAGVIMILINPWVLFFDISFQLSFLATYGLISFSPFFEKWLSWIPPFLELRASAVATLSAQVIVTPLLLYAIGDFSIISPLVNVIVLFAVPWAMLLGFIASFSFIPVWFAYVAYIPLRYVTWVVEHLSEVPLAVVTVPPFHPLVMVVMYILILLWYMYLTKKNPD